MSKFNYGPERKAELNKLKERRTLALEAFENGTTAQELADILGITRTRVYQLLEKAREERDVDSV